MRTIRWGIASTAMVAAIAAVVMFGVWYGSASQWHPTRDGWEGKVTIDLWPPSIGWGERLVQQ